MAVIHSDDFNRANSTTTAGTPVVGGPYTATTGTWGINNNQLYQVTSTALGRLSFPASYNFDVTFTMTALVNSVSQGLVFRMIDASNYWLLYMNSSNTNALLHRVNAASGSNVMNLGIPIVANDLIKIVAVDRQIYMYINGVLRGQMEDVYSNTASIMAFYTTNTGTRFDNITVSAPPTDPATTLDGSLVDEHSPGSGGFDTHVVKGRSFHIDDEGEVP